MFGLSAFFASAATPLPVSESEPATKTSVLIHLHNGKRLYLDQNTISKQRLDHLRKQHQRQVYTVPLTTFCLPLDLRSYLFLRAPDADVPACLGSFLGQAECLWAALRDIDAYERELVRLEALGRGDALDGCFCKMVTAVISPLQVMAGLLECVARERPEELHGCRHAIDEWRADLKAALKDVGETLYRAAGIIKRPGGGVEKAVLELGRMRRMRLLRQGFARWALLSWAPAARGRGRLIRADRPAEIAGMEMLDEKKRGEGHGREKQALQAGIVQELLVDELVGLRGQGAADDEEV